MSNAIKNWAITALCLSLLLVIWFVSDPTRLGHWEAQRDISYDSIWSEYLADCDCVEFLE
jgi:hypothetical protein